MIRFIASLALLTASIAASPAGAGPVGAHVAMGFGSDNSACGFWGVCPEVESLAISATEGGIGKATYRPQSGDSVAISLDCTAFSAWGGHGFIDRASAHLLEASGMGSDGKRYYVTLEDGHIDDLFFVTTAASSGQCGASRLWYGMSLYVSDFTITHAGNLPPVAAIEYECDGDVCAFDGTGSVDVDGSIVAYSWSFYEGYDSWYFLGDRTGSKVAFTFADRDRPKHATLMVTDDSGDTATFTVENIFG